MLDILAKIIPIIFLMILGYTFKTRKLLKPESIKDINKIVINISLPAILFTNFLTMQLEKEYISIVLINIFLLIMLYLIGVFINRFDKFAHPLTPFILTGFSFGLFGIPLFRTVFGPEHLGNLLILGIANEIFIWIIFVPLIKFSSDKSHFSFKRIKDFFMSPLVLSIILGIIFNIAGLEMFFKENSYFKGLYETLKYLGDLATPLILIGVGFGLKFTKKYMKKSTIFVASRIILILMLGYIIKFLFINKIMSSNQYFNYAYFTFLILPPPFSLPIFLTEYGGRYEYRELINNTVMLSTVTSVVIYILFVFLISLNI